MYMTKSPLGCYALAGLAVAWFLFFPEPVFALTGALLLQTIAFISIGGRSSADAIVLTGISISIFGLLSEHHSLIHGSFYPSIQPWIIAVATLTLVTGLWLKFRGKH